MVRTPSTDRAAKYWKRLGIVPGAPECVIKAAHLALIEVHHPDRGGDPGTAREINAAYDELKGRGSEANEYVATHYGGEPWVVLGVSSAADARLISRAGKQLAAELHTHRRLADRVEWALQNFASALAAPHRDRIGPLTPPPSSRRKPTPRPTAPSSPGIPEGLVPRIDFGTIAWGAKAAYTMQLTWKHAAPYGVTIETDGPVRAEVSASKVLPGRFSIAFSVDWDASELSRVPPTRGYILDLPIAIRWTSRDTATIRAKGRLVRPRASAAPAPSDVTSGKLHAKDLMPEPVVSASPSALDLGSAKLGKPVRASVVLVSTAPVDLTIEPTAWLQRVDGSGRVLDAPLALATNVPMRVEFHVHWPPIAERGRVSFAAGRTARATGRIVVRWNDRKLEIPAEITVAK